MKQLNITRHQLCADLNYIIRPVNRNLIDGQLPGQQLLPWQAEEYYWKIINVALLELSAARKGAVDQYSRVITMFSPRCDKTIHTLG